MENITFLDIMGGYFLMGATTLEGHILDRETPQVEVKVNDFKISETTITNFQFSKFAEESGYITTAEKLGGSYVFHLLLDETYRDTIVDDNSNWWIYVKGANWKHPFGPNSNINNILDHPVVHISYFDALEFCEWYGYRLPSEAEWEYAARAGSKYRWSWGDEFLIDNVFQANIWQGDFPHNNTMEDGYLGTAPAKSFKANQFGLYNVIGNVWEWCMNPRYMELSKFNEFDYVINPPFNLNNITENTEFAQRGGSFLCHPSYCNRYRLGARNGNSASSTTSNCGFRVAI